MDVKSIIFFGAGLISGSIATYFILNKKYADIADEEIQSVKEVFGRNKETVAKKEEINYQKPSLSEIIKGEKYSFNLDKDKDPESYVEKISKPDSDPYLIEPDSFGESDYYEAISMSYYSDGVLVEDLTQEIVFDIDGTIGEESLNHFGDPTMGFEEGVIYVRNDALSADYEVTMVPSTYSEEKEYLNSLRRSED